MWQAGLIGVVTFCWVALAHAFPPLAGISASVKVAPWVPTPEQHVLITVSDAASGNYGLNPDFSEVGATRNGNTITVAAKFQSTISSDITVATRTVDVGALPPGRYTVVYSSDSASNPSYHQATMQFSVTTGGLTTVVEFYNAEQDHYFITADAAEQALLDNGTMRGWVRTGETFKVMFGEDMQTSAKSICRFYGLPSTGLDSHFFSASMSECIDVLNRWPLQWQLETTNAFGITAEVPQGSCPADSQAVYRLFNNRADVNHRYTTSKTTRDAMLAKGWILEGGALTPNSLERVAMCAPI
ncbi:MAG: hypothetical protein U1F10_00510 [Burkholderiales bacterium]